MAVYSTLFGSTNNFQFKMSNLPISDKRSLQSNAMFRMFAINQPILIQSHKQCRTIDMKLEQIISICNFIETLIYFCKWILN